MFQHTKLYRLLFPKTLNRNSPQAAAMINQYLPPPSEAELVKARYKWARMESATLPQYHIIAKYRARIREETFKRFLRAAHPQYR